jgi:hypothetical protein
VHSAPCRRARLTLGYRVGIVQCLGGLPGSISIVEPRRRYRGAVHGAGLLEPILLQDREIKQR